LYFLNFCQAEQPRPIIQHNLGEIKQCKQIEEEEEEGGKKGRTHARTHTYTQSGVDIKIHCSVLPLLLSVA